MAFTIYELGDLARLTLVLQVAGVPTDGTVAATVRAPDGTSTEYGVEIVHDSTGNYHLDVACSQPGDWDYEFRSSGAVIDVETGGFYVKPDPTAATLFGRDLCALRDVYRLVPGFDPLEIDNGDTVETLANLISAESQSIHNETSREFVAIANASARVFDLTASICRRRSIAIGDAAAITSVELFDFDGATSLGVLATSLYVALPRIREDWRPITRLSFPFRPGSVLRIAPGRTLTITGTWGFPKIPLDLRQACAKRVLLRYVADNANAGTRLADAIDDTFSLGSLLRSSSDVVKSYRSGPFA